MNKIFIAILLWFCPILSIQAQTKDCAKGMEPVKDIFLQTAVTNFQKNNTDIFLYQTENPCDHMPNMIKALGGTLRKDYLGKNIKGYEIVTVVWKIDNRRFFVIERFILKSKKAIQRLEDALKRTEDRRLIVKSDTYYNYFISGNSVIFMSTPAPVYDKTLLWFREIQQDFLAAAQSIH